MNGIVYHIASGHAFFTGIALVLVAALLSIVRSPLAIRVSGFALVIGAIALVISSAAIPYWSYALLAIGILGSGFDSLHRHGTLSGCIDESSGFACFALLDPHRLAESRADGPLVRRSLAWIVTHRGQWKRWGWAALLGSCTIALALESPHHLRWNLSPAPNRRLTVIGDSITAGTGTLDASQRWPAILARRHDLTVQDISHAGDTVSLAMKRLDTSPIEADVVLIELGGNDLLGSTNSHDFARDLDALLARVATPERQVVMLELPLPPFCNEYGRAQRRLAHKHGVVLAPKRYLLSVIAPSTATLDTIHLTRNGHEQMAETVWMLVASAYR
ncbi:Esterase TesA precursor [Planctomycetes bacterium Pan216]|uniref:Esterase TesA n=1 Tax=Kolteria novifilia TaxID=2527975 RepID=A0A518B3T3_9BACT|nr:Esterase TesA precursor [Planctomycetes bacterium Pan216]